jgi:hypothetical protein
MRFYRGNPPFPTQEVQYRQHKANLNTNQRDWTQAFVRIRPYSRPKDQIDVYEYYWAPVITGRVSALQSLKFLIFAGLSPFQYLRDNLIAINAAEKAAVRKGKKPAGRRRKSQWFVSAFVRELCRMLFIFIPTIAISLGMYYLLAKPIGQILRTSPMRQMGHFFTRRLDFWMDLRLMSFSIRVLFAGMCVIFLLQEFTAHTKAASSQKSPRLYVVFILALLSGLILIPRFLHGHIRLQERWHWFRTLPGWEQAACIAGVLVALIGLSFASSVLRSAWRRARNRAKTILANRRVRNVLACSAVVLVAAGIAAAVIRPNLNHAWKAFVHFLALPGFIHWQAVGLYTLLALIVYMAQMVLTGAIGCLAVYLGSDDLSKNFAARSQILNECTTMLIDLLSGLDENRKANAEWNYDEVLIAAHSLGSVIAYDTLNDLAVRRIAGGLKDVPLWKIKGLLTFGCPLNKVVYFFRARTDLRKNVLSQLLYALHPLRLRTPLPDEANPAIARPFPLPESLPFAEEFKWFNAYSPFDIISGRMQFYRADHDVAVEKGVAPWTAHLSYWDNDDLYSLFSRLL